MGAKTSDSARSQTHTASEAARNRVREREKQLIVTMKSFLWRKKGRGGCKFNGWGEVGGGGEQGRGFGNKVTVCYA